MGDAEHYAMDDGHSTAVVVSPARLPTTLRATSVLAGLPTLRASALIGAVLASNAPTHVLMLAHNCKNSSCRLRDCRLCEGAVRKRCNKAKATSPIIDSTAGVRVACGATLDVDVVLKSNMSKVVDAPPGTCVHMFLVNAAAYDAAIVRKNWRPPRDDVVPVLMTAGAVQRVNMPAYHVLRQGGGQARSPPAPDVVHQAVVNSFASFTPTPRPGDEWNVRLVGTDRVRLVAALVDAATGEPVPRMAAAVSETFVVHTQRRRLIKAEIARVADEVTVLPGIGLAGANSLAALARTAPDIELPADLGAIHTVGDMMRLAQACEADRALDDGVRTVLSLSRSVWVKAKRVALAAVEPDCRLRAFYTNSYNRGLVFSCVDGCVDLSTPVAVLVALAVRVANVPPGMATLPCASFPDRVISGHRMAAPEDVDRADLARLIRQARVAWMQAGHPKWTILSGGGRHFDSLRQMQSYMTGRVVAGVPALDVHVA